MQDSGTAIRIAAAQVREILSGLAAELLRAPADQLNAATAAVVGAGRAPADYGALVPPGHPACRRRSRRHG